MNPSPSFRISLLRLMCLLALALGGLAFGQAVPETVIFDVPSSIAVNPNPVPTAQLSAVVGYPADVNRLTLIGLLYRPDPLIHGPGPYPTVVVLHGSGGMWQSDTIASGAKTALRRWGERLAERGFLCLMPDSFNPRGIPGNFGSRRPHHDSAIDDAVCSPNYERPKDVVAALTYLQTRTDVDFENIGLLGFSHGSQTGLNAVLDASVDLGNYTVDYVNELNATVKLAVPSPVRIPADLPFPRVGIFYYPGCGHFSYHGSPNSKAAGRYMPDRRMQVVMYHGTNDSLLGVSDPNASPKTGSLYPIKFTVASGAQAASLGLPNPFVQHHLFDLVNHSFDETTIEPQANWNTGLESPDEKANRLARDETLKWLEFRLRRHVLTPAPDPNVPGGLMVSWMGRDQLLYQHKTSIDLVNWMQAGGDIIGNGTMVEVPVVLPMEQRSFHQLIVQPVPAPVNDLLYQSFFLEYADFSY
ncbi:MAG: dienelactone hydrolase family protein [Verrucomicrobiaceae bacterium]|nr:dienelactone hydrolase family protein [Verrucomicrobiaceae bacterium]